MRRVFSMFCLLMMALTVWSATVAQAAEADACVEVSGTEIGHFEGDSDQVPGDSDKGTTHHHAVCHGHCFAIADLDLEGTELVSRPAQVAVIEHQLGSGADPGLTLRPPIA